MVQTETLHSPISVDEARSFAEHVRDLQERPLSDDENYQLTQIEAISTMHELVVDDGPVSGAASILYEVMCEFATDDEPFQPSTNPELRQFLVDVVTREYPNLTDAEQREVFETVQDFPPVAPQDQLALAA